MSEMKNTEKVCPLCEREIAKPFDKHHLIPKSKGGKDTVFIHRICHSKIHSVLTRSQLAKGYYEIGKLKEHPEITKFVNWISSKPPSFYSRTRKMK